MKNSFYIVGRRVKQLCFILSVVISTFNSTSAQLCPDTLILPRNQSVCPGTIITLSIDTNYSVASANILWSTGDTTTSITYTATQSQYVSLSISKGESACKDSVFIDVIQLPTIITTNTNVICVPFTATLKAQPAISHQWYRFGTAISGATGQIFNASNGGDYYCEATNACGRFTSNVINIAKYFPPTITMSVAGSSTICPGDSVSINSITNAALPTYQWYRNNLLIAGATNPTYKAGQSGNYKLEVFNNATTCSRKSSAVKITNSPLTASISAAPCNTGTVTFSSTTNAINPTYQWYRNNVLIAGATNASYVANSKGYYKVFVTDLSTGCLKSSATIQITTLCRMGEFYSTKNIVVYPNPFSNTIHFDVSEDVNPQTVNVYNLLGKIVFNKTYSSEMDLKALPSGLYLIEVLDESNKVIQRQRIEKIN
jgi:hypothetical protein